MCYPEPLGTDLKLSEVDPIERLCHILDCSPSKVRAAIRGKWTQLCYLAHKAHDEMERKNKIDAVVKSFVHPYSAVDFLNALEKEGLEIVPKQRKAM